MAIDVWTNHSFWGIVGSFTDENLQGHTVLLGCEDTQGHHTTKNINEIYEEVLRRWNVQCGVISVVSDSASNTICLVSMNLGICWIKMLRVMMVGVSNPPEIATFAETLAENRLTRYKRFYDDTHVILAPLLDRNCTIMYLYCSCSFKEN